MDEQKAENKAVIQSTILISSVLILIILVGYYYEITFATPEWTAWIFGGLVFAAHLKLVETLKKKYIGK